MRWAGHVAHMGEEKKMYRILAGKPEGKTLLARPRCRLVDGIRSLGHWLGVCKVDPVGSGKGLVVSSCKYSDGSVGSDATE
jgi:hypothetical protein